MCSDSLDWQLPVKVLCKRKIGGLFSFISKGTDSKGNCVTVGLENFRNDRAKKGSAEAMEIWPAVW
jgi:hypothetical protein